MFKQSSCMRQFVMVSCLALLAQDAQARRKYTSEEIDSYCISVCLQGKEDGFKTYTQEIIETDTLDEALEEVEVFVIEECTGKENVHINAECAVKTIDGTYVHRKPVSVLWGKNKSRKHHSERVTAAKTERVLCTLEKELQNSFLKYHSSTKRFIKSAIIVTCACVTAPILRAYPKTIL